MHTLTHVLHLLEPPGIAAGVVLIFALMVRLFWRHGKSATRP
jgi:hypothetical protein